MGDDDESPAALVSLQKMARVPTAPEANWMELVLPSLESTPPPPPALVMAPPGSMAQAYREPTRAVVDAVYVLPEVALAGAALEQPGGGSAVALAVLVGPVVTVAFVSMQLTESDVEALMVAVFIASPLVGKVPVVDVPPLATKVPPVTVQR